MTRKDYRAIAAALKAQQPAEGWSANKHEQYTLDVRALAKVLAADNPRFDYARFYEAAGLVQPGPGEGWQSIHAHSSACDCRQKAA